MSLRVDIQQLPHGMGLPLPAYQTAHAAGLDLSAAVPEEAPVPLAPGQHAMIPTGLSIALPADHEAQVRPRSGLAAKHSVTVLNAPGTIDADYRGEICVLLINHGSETFLVRRGERIAQMVIAPVSRVELVPISLLSTTDRGSGGFGSTGR
jgi:dUTP pyrophosphatase